MAMTKAGIETDGSPDAVQSTTTETPHDADKSSAPGPYEDLTAERPPVSTSSNDVEIAHSLVSGAGAPSPPSGPDPSTVVAENAYVTAADKDNIDPAYVDKPKAKAKE